MIKIAIKKQSPRNHKAEAILVGHYEGRPSPEGAAGELDKAGDGILSALIASGDFTGKLNETALVYTRGILPSKRILLIGLGKADRITAEKLRNAYAAAARRMRDLKVRKFSVALDFGNDVIDIEQAASAAVEGMLLGLYRYIPFKTKTDELSQVEAITLIDEKSGNLKLLKGAVRESEVICGGVYLARDLVSAPSNEMTPAILAGEALRLKETSSLSVKIIEAPAMKRFGMNALLGVARGSCNPPKLIVMEHRGGKKQDPPLVLVGKGITFDSGGISIKPSENMHRMKDDMAGGAAVIGALKASAELALPVNVIGLVPAAENLPDGCAYKPGDVLRSLSGQTIEIISTDAEGRLILADVLTYTKRFKPAAIIDIATLTGACVIALGDYLTGMFVNDEGLKEKLTRASRATGEALWELPLWDEYEDLIKSDVADIKNTGTRAGGAITAALFLKKFTGDYPWAHLDIAGPCFLAKDKGYIPKGASGVGVRLLVQFLKSWTDNKNEPDSRD